MITAYRQGGTSEVILASESRDYLDADIVWLDLVHPDRAEENFIEKLVGIELPTREDLKDIEPSSRLYIESDTVYMTASLVAKAESAPEIADVAFILTNKRLVTIRYAEPRAFALFSSAFKRNSGKCGSGVEVMARLFETIVDRTAEVLELAVKRVDELSTAVFVDRKMAKRRPPRFLEDRLLDIAAHHRLVSKARDSLITLARLASFLRELPQVRENREASELGHMITSDVQSLSEHAAFVANNITFMLDASLGLISVEQNAIIKIFSIASVVFLPPTLVASIYGMNFRHMPELDWTLGYPLALGGMLVSAIVPFLFFRWKGWL